MRVFLSFIIRVKLIHIIVGAGDGNFNFTQTFGDGTRSRAVVFARSPVRFCSPPCLRYQQLIAINQRGHGVGTDETHGYMALIVVKMFNLEHRNDNEKIHPTCLLPN